MDEARARAMFEAARRAVGPAAGYEPLDCDVLDEQAFLGEYCWVVYASGFRYAVVRDKFPAIEAAFRGFDPAALGAMDWVDPRSLPIRNRRKAEGFLAGCHAIAAEGFDAFKARVADGGPDVLEELPGIGPVVKHHLAKNIGLSDTAKPDVWLVRCAEACDATVEELATYLAEAFTPIKRHEVDTILWTYCQRFQEVPNGEARPLTAADLAAATAYQTSAEAALLAVLDAARTGCGIPATSGNRWACDEHSLWYQTPWVDDRHFFEFGFDFDREDEGWSVARLALPSAYCALCEAEGDEDAFDWKLVPDGWTPPPAERDWTEGTIRVKQIAHVRVEGGSLEPQYVDFLLSALYELKELTGLA